MARLTSALVLAALLHAAGASARETATTTSTASAACQTGIQQILKPAAAANLTQKVRFHAYIFVSFPEYVYSTPPARCLCNTAQPSTLRRGA
jgi:hypothetical protein